METQRNMNKRRGGCNVSTIMHELNAPATLELVARCHLGPQSCKLEIQDPKLVKLCHLSPYPFVTYEYM
jgi:hypothetical protein